MYLREVYFMQQFNPLNRIIYSLCEHPGLAPIHSRCSSSSCSLLVVWCITVFNPFMLKGSSVNSLHSIHAERFKCVNGNLFISTHHSAATILHLQRDNLRQINFVSKLSISQRQCVITYLPLIFIYSFPSVLTVERVQLQDILLGSYRFPKAG